MMQHQDFRSYELKRATSVSATKTPFTVTNPCPICGGYDSLRRGRGERCYGFLSSDGQYAYCTREEYAGPIELYGNTNAYLHYLAGPCRCGIDHDGDIDDSDDGVVVQRLSVDSNTDKPLPWRDEPDHTYDYTDEEGNVAYQVLRYDATANRDKTFSQRRKDPTKAHEWAYNLNGCKRYPYNLQEVRNAPLDTPIIIVEGEKCVDRLKELGFVATCNSGGAGQWRDELDDHFRGRQVVIIPDVGDNNGVGERHAENVAQHLSKVAHSVTVARLPGIIKGDVVDWLEDNHTADDLQAVIKTAPIWNPAASDDVPADNVAAMVGRVQPTDKSQHPKRLQLVSYEELAARPLTPMRYLVHPYLPAGEFTLLYGPPKSYKSFLAMDWALSIASDQQLLGGDSVEPGLVIYLDLENSLDRLRERIDARLAHNGLTTDTLQGQLMLQDRNKNAAPWRADHDAIQELSSVIEEHHPVLVVVDNLRKALPAKVNENHNDEVNPILNNLIDACGKADSALLLVHHTNRGNELFSGAGCLESTPANTISIIKDRHSGIATVRSVVTRNAPDFEAFGVYMGSDGALRLTEAVDAQASYGEDIITALLDNELTVQELVTATGMSEPKVRTQVERLGQTGAITVVAERQGAKGGKPSKVYGLVKP